MSSAVLMEHFHPEGTLQDVYYRCSTPGPEYRRMLVYLPKGYEENDTTRYPVMYLFHGARGNETSWIIDGNMMAIQDSLVACGKVMPTIIVLTNMNSYVDDDDYANSRFKRPFESFFETDGTAEATFVQDVVSLIDSRYNTVPDKDHRIICGMSLGAMQATYISAANPDTFGYVGLLSPMIQGPIRYSPYSSFYSGLAKKQKVQYSNPPKLHYIEIGRMDPFVEHMKHYRIYLEQRKIPYEFHLVRGAHQWKFWQLYYADFMKRVSEFFL